MEDRRLILLTASPSGLLTQAEFHRLADVPPEAQ